MKTWNLPPSTKGHRFLVTQSYAEQMTAAEIVALNEAHEQRARELEGLAEHWKEQYDRTRRQLTAARGGLALFGALLFCIAWVALGLPTGGSYFR